VQCPRPLHHLTFIPSAACLVGSADYGLVACFDLTGQWRWRDGLVAHTGSLTVSGDGSQIVLACFSEGLLRYELTGKKLGRIPCAEPCRLASLSFDGRLILVGGLGPHLLLLDREGQTLRTQRLERPAVALALGPLGDKAYVALAEGAILCYDIRERPPGSGP
jgi:hypothetical protein